MISLGDIVRAAARARLQDATIVESLASISEPAHPRSLSPPAVRVS